MIDYSNHKKGDTISLHCCNDCIRNHGIKPKYPADSGAKSYFCYICGHYGIGSTMDCIIGDWLNLIPVKEKSSQQFKSV